MASLLIGVAAVTVARADDGDTTGTGLNVEVLASSPSASASPSPTVGGVSTTDSGTATNGTVGTTTNAGTSTTSGGTSTTSATDSGIAGLLYVSGLSWTYLPSLNPLDGSLNLRFTVRNVYHQTLSASAGLWLNHVFGGAIDVPINVAVDKLKAGETRTVEATFHGLAQWMIVTGHATLTVPGTVDQVLVAPIARDAVIWFLPWFLVLLIAGVAGWIVWRRLRPRPAAVAARTPPTGAEHRAVVAEPDEALAPLAGPDTVPSPASGDL
jgi:hypothetical protein